MKLPAELVASLSPHYAGRPVCVTGGAGFIGGHLVDALLSLGAVISVLDDLSNSSLDHLGDLIDLEPQRLRFVQGSVLDDDAVAEAVRGSQAIFHLAAIGSIPRSVAEPQRFFSVNATGSVRLLEAARRHGVPRFVHSSSSSVYGEAPGAAAKGGPAAAGAPGASVPARVESQLPQPLSPYAASKVAAEAAVQAWSRSYGLGAVCLRYFNIFGPRQASDSAYAAVIPAFAKRLLAGQAPVIYGDGQQSRDFTPVACAVAANLLAGSTTRELRGQAVNIGTGRRTEVLQIARLMADRTDSAHLQPVLEPARPSEVRHAVADISLAGSLLDYRPIGTLEEALDETVAHYKRAYAEAP